MTIWKAKRFWSVVSLEREGSGWSVHLDGRPLRTPAKNALVVPTEAMANTLADEWSAVEVDIDPRRMPVTRAANAAVDKVRPQFDEVARLVADYGGTDLLCYRAADSDDLAAAQAEAWDPMLNWARDTLGAELVATRGVAPVAQPRSGQERLLSLVMKATEFELTALHDLVSLSGSLILGLAATRPDFSPGKLWSLSRFDETWQAKSWGQDGEALADAEIKRQEFFRARDFWMLAQPEVP
ncbi:MAG: ATP12 family protein [Paracoccaceae bacterium]